MDTCKELGTTNYKELLGRVHATVAYLKMEEKQYGSEPVRAMRSILDGANIEDVLGRVNSVIGYIVNDTYPIWQERLVYEMVTQEKFTEEEPDNAATSTDSETE